MASADGFVTRAGLGDTKDVRRRLQRRQPVNAKHSTLKYTALHAAADHGRLAVVKVLVEHGADVNAQRTFFLETPLHFAAASGHADVVQFLLDSGADRLRFDRGGLRPLEMALQFRRQQCVEILGELPDAVGKPYSAESSHTSILLRWRYPFDDGVVIDKFEIEVVQLPDEFIPLAQYEELKDRARAAKEAARLDGEDVSESEESSSEEKEEEAVGEANVEEDATGNQADSVSPRSGSSSSGADSPDLDEHGVWRRRPAAPDVDIDALPTVVHTGSQLCEYRIEDSQAYTPFRVRVRAHTMVGWGEWGKSSLVTTQASPPHAPPNVRVINNTINHLDIDWGVPRANGRPILGYRVEITHWTPQECFDLYDTVSRKHARRIAAQDTAAIQSDSSVGTGSGSSDPDYSGDDSASDTEAPSRRPSRPSSGATPSTVAPAAATGTSDSRPSSSPSSSSSSPPSPPPPPVAAGAEAPPPGVDVWEVRKFVGRKLPFRRPSTVAPHDVYVPPEAPSQFTVDTTGRAVKRRPTTNVEPAGPAARKDREELAQEHAEVDLATTLGKPVDLSASRRRSTKRLSAWKVSMSPARIRETQAGMATAASPSSAFTPVDKYVLDDDSDDDDGSGWYPADKPPGDVALRAASPVFRSLAPARGRVPSAPARTSTPAAEPSPGANAVAAAQAALLDSPVSDPGDSKATVGEPWSTLRSVPAAVTPPPFAPPPPQSLPSDASRPPPLDTSLPYGGPLAARRASPLRRVSRAFSPLTPKSSAHRAGAEARTPQHSLLRSVSSSALLSDGSIPSPKPAASPEPMPVHEEDPRGPLVTWELVTDVIPDFQTEYTVEGLKTGHGYSVRVSAKNVLGWGPPSPPSAFFRMPAVVAMAMATRSTLVVKWAQPFLEFMGPDKTSSIAALGEDGCNLVHTKWRPSHSLYKYQLEYQVCLADQDDGCMVWRPYHRHRDVAESKRAPSPAHLLPEDTAGGGEERTAFQPRCANPYDDIPAAGGPWRTALVSSGSHGRVATVEGLLPGTRYRFRLRSKFRYSRRRWLSWQRSPLSPWLRTDDGLPMPPTMPAVRGDKAAIAYVNWRAPRANGTRITMYQLEWRRVHGNFHPDDSDSGKSEDEDVELVARKPDDPDEKIFVGEHGPYRPGRWRRAGGPVPTSTALAGGVKARKAREKAERELAIREGRASEFLRGVKEDGEAAAGAATSGDDGSESKLSRDTPTSHRSGASRRRSTVRSGSSRRRSRRATVLPDGVLESARASSLGSNRRASLRSGRPRRGSTLSAVTSTWYDVPNVVEDTPGKFGTELEYAVVGLRAGAVFEFRLRALNDIGWGEPSPASPPLRLAPMVPDEPSAPVVVPFTPTSFLVTWSVPRSNGSAVRKVTMQRLKIRSGDHPNESDTDADDSDNDARTFTTFDTGGSAQKTATDGASAASPRGLEDAALPDNATPTAACGGGARDDDAGTVHSLASMTSAAFVRAQAKKERWRRIKLPAVMGAGKGTRVGTSPPYLSEEQASVLPAHRPWVQFEVEGVFPGSVHVFRLRYRNKVGWSPHGLHSAELKALPDVPTMPVDVVSLSLSPYSVLLRWKAPHHNGAPLKVYHLQGTRMRHCPDVDDSDSDFEEAGAARAEHLGALRKGVPPPPPRGPSELDPWADIPVSDWIASSLGARIAHVLKVVSSGQRIHEDSDDDEFDTPRGEPPVDEDDLDVTVPLSAAAFKQLEAWAFRKQKAIAAKAALASLGRRDDAGGGAPDVMFAADGSMIDEAVIRRRKRVDELVGPRLHRSYGAPLAWIVTGLRPGTWHSFRVAAGNDIGEGVMTPPTAFLRTQAAEPDPPFPVYNPARTIESMLLACRLGRSNGSRVDGLRVQRRRLRGLPHPDASDSSDSDDDSGNVKDARLWTTALDGLPIAPTFATFTKEDCPTLDVACVDDVVVTTHGWSGRFFAQWLEGLVSGTQHYVRVQVRNGVGWSKPSDPIHVCFTDPDVPRSPPRPVLYLTSPYVVHSMVWRPHDNGSRVTHFDVQFRRLRKRRGGKRFQADAVARVRALEGVPEPPPATAAAGAGGARPVSAATTATATTVDYDTDSNTLGPSLDVVRDGGWKVDDWVDIKRFHRGATARVPPACLEHQFPVPLPEDTPEWVDAALPDHEHADAAPATWVGHAAMGTHPGTVGVVAAAHPRVSYLEMDGILPRAVNQFRVRAVNAVGAGPWSRASIPVKTTRTAPLPPGVVKLKGTADALLSLYWAPARANGYPVQRYHLQYYVHKPPRPGWIEDTKTEEEVAREEAERWVTVRDDLTQTFHLSPELVHGMGYVFRARARNKVGWGLFSEPSDVLYTDRLL